MHIPIFSFLGHLDDTFAGGWLAGRPAGLPSGRPNLKIMLTSSQLGLAGAWAELGKNTKNRISTCRSSAY